MYLITGSRGLIGTYLCEKLRKDGIKYIGIDISRIDDKDTSEYQLDIVNDVSLEHFLSTIWDNGSRLDGVIHLAGIDYKIDNNHKKNSQENINYGLSNPAEALKSINANISMAYNIIYRLIPRFMEQGHGKIILMGSIYGSYSPNPELYKDEEGNISYQKPLEYCLSKSTFPMFAKYICAHYAKYGINCINIEPHAIIKNAPSQFLDNFSSLSPMKRTCSVKELCDFIVDLLLSKCHYINGETIKIDGGWTVF